MALGAGTFQSAGGAVNDLFAGFAAKDQGELRAKGLEITAAGTRTQASGTRIQAEGTRIGAESTRLSAESLRIKAGGDIAEAENYDLAAALARGNETYEEFSTRVKQAQNDRQLTQTLGGIRANVGAAGFTGGGSALDILRDSASQGALARGVLGMQGAITQAGYEEQARSYETMSKAGRATAAGEIDIAGKTEGIAGRQEGIAGQQEGLATQQEGIATQQDQLAQSTRDAASKAATGDFISAAFKGAAAIASLVPGGDLVASVGGAIGGAVIPGNWGEQS